MTQMELSKGGDTTNYLVLTSGDAKKVPLNGDDDDHHHHHLFISTKNQVLFDKNGCAGNGEKISNGFSYEENISNRYDHEEDTSDNVDSFEDSNDDDHEEKVNLSLDTIGDRDTCTKILKIEVEEGECTPATEKVYRDSTEKNVNNETLGVGSKINCNKVQILIPPNSQLPKPEAPPGVIIDRSQSSREIVAADYTPSIGKLFWEKSNILSSVITKRLSFLTDNKDENDCEKFILINVTEFNLSGVKVIVNSHSNNEVEETEKTGLKGRISFFSKSNCRDCRAVRSFFRERNLRYVEINTDVFPTRKKELIEKTGSCSVPQIFFNERLFGGLVALNSLRNGGILEEKLEELLSKTCPDTAPAVPVYGFDDAEEEGEEERMVDIVRILRQRLCIQDRLMKMKIVKNCFSGAEMVDVIMKHYAGFERIEAVEIGKQLAQKHFVHHVFGENEFDDGNHYYRFLEHEPFIPRCFNFQGSTNDTEPKAAAIISQRLTKLMSAILESYVSDDRHHLNYIAIRNSEEFRRYVNLVQNLHRVNILSLSADEKLAFFLNLFNAMVIHAVIKVGHPEGVVDRRSFNSDFFYVIGGHPYSLTTIKNGILRSNRRAPYSLVKPFGGGDKRLELAFPMVNPLIHFGLCNGTRSSPVVRFFTPQGVESELRCATREFFQKDGMEVDLAKRTVSLTRIIKWFDVDFGKEKEILNWIMKYLDATKAGLLTHLLDDGGPVNIVYQNYDWSSNC